ncbi:MAG: GGDEF domain-containing protein [Lachnospiraceae bacterium]|nr:GGDEF domain-containing protein [Lachnospiraceae bacterium]
MSYYASFGILSIIIHVIINIGAMGKAKDETPVAKKYRMFLWGLLLFYLCDILWGVMNGLGIVSVAYAFTVLFFSTMVFSLLLWVRFIVTYLDRDTLFSKLFSYAGWSIFLFEMGALFFNFFIPIVFRFDENGVYQPGRARYVTLTIQILLFSVTSIYTLIVAAREHGENRRHYAMVGLSGAVMTLFVILQTGYPLLPMYSIGCLIATCLIHTFVVADEMAMRNREIGAAKQKAYRDSLTKVGNKLAYTETKDKMDQRIREGSLKEFGVAVFDLNDLKLINDTLGHDAGDKYIQDASRLICRVFAHSPVYRIGGDEFVAVLRGEDYDNRRILMTTFSTQVEMNLKNGDVIVSGGMEEYDPARDSEFESVFERADRKMYECKKRLKILKKVTV